MHGELGSRIRILRQRKGLTQQEIGFRTGISIPHISSIERGQRHPSLDYAVRIAEALGVPIGYLCESAATTSLPDDLNYSKPDELPAYLQTFIALETAQPYLAMAQRVSRLEESDYHMLCAMVEIMAQRKRLKILTDD
ncbi:MAG: helix-turn-helix transcriptional regulator [Firmicutes bacterium]|nr:helix-turn-helix transcriptional regulator [Bacillota bacterium]